MRPEIIFNPLNKLLDKITPYRLVFYTLLTYVASAMLFNAVGWLPYTYNWLGIAVLAVWAAAICRVSNLAFARLFNVARNKNSDLISALIITLVWSPVLSAEALLGVGVAAVAAMASKYLIAPNRRHIFNPAVTGIVVAELVTRHLASWWVGAPFLMPVVAVGGLIILFKMKRFTMAGVFLTTFFTILIIGQLLGGADIAGLWSAVLAVVLSSPLLFFEYIMLIEPHTSPLSPRRGIVYAATVGLFYAAPLLPFLSFYLPPEIALLLGNAFNYVISGGRRLVLKLVDQKRETDGVYSFTFTEATGHYPKFQAGQYMEWTIPNRHSDTRGNRRYFTVASSPTEKELMLATRVPAPDSSFKQQLMAMKPGDTLLAADVTGSFVLPEATDRKLAFLAGGIGVTPFRSIAKYLTDVDQRRDIRHICFGNSPTDFAFTDIFAAAEKVGVQTTYEAVRINPELIKTDIPDYKERVFYLSGPLVFVQSAEKILLDLGVKRRQIRKDFFPGYGS